MLSSPGTRARRMARLCLQLFGGFRAWLDPGDVVRMPTRKVEALLAYLALPAGQTHPRDKLASLLWGELSEAQARASLRQSLFRLRRALGVAEMGRLRVDGDGVALDPTGVAVAVAACGQTLDATCPAAHVRV